MAPGLTVEKVAQPLTRLPVINTLSVYLEQRSLLAAVNYSDLKRDAALFLINADTLDVEKHPLPEGANCGHRSLVRADDATLYLTSTNGSLYAFDLDTRTFKKRAVLFEGKTFLAGAYVSGSGRLYVGNYPEAYIVEYDPATGNVRRFETLPRDGLGLYTMGFIDLPDGTLLALTVGGNPGITVFDPRTGSREIVYHGDPEHEARGFFDGFLDDDRVLVTYRHRVRTFNWQTRAFEDDLISDFPEAIFKMVEADGARYFSGHQSRSMYKLRGGEVSVARKDFPDLNLVSNYHYLGGGEFICVGDNGLFMRFNLDSGDRVTRQIDNVTDRGMGLQFLSKIPGEDVVVGAVHGTWAKAPHGDLRGHPQWGDGLGDCSSRSTRPAIMPMPTTLTD